MLPLGTRNNYQERISVNRMLRNPFLYLILIIMVLLLLNLSSIYKKTITYDESDHFEFGKRILTEEVVEAHGLKMAISVLNAIPVYMLEKFTNNFSAMSQKPFRNFTDRKKLFIGRTPTIVVSAILSIFVFLWAKNLYGVKAAFFSLLLYVFCPNVLAHSRLITNDVYCMSFMFLGTYFFIQYLQQASVKKLLISASLTGCALASKHTALMLLPIFMLLLLSSRYISSMKIPNSHASLLKTSMHMILFLFIVIVVINVSYGFKEISTNKYILFPKAYVTAFSLGQQWNAEGIGSGLKYLLGKHSQYGFWHYYIICLLLKVPLAIFIFGVASLFLLKRYLSKNTLDEIVLILIPLGIFIYFSFFCTAQVGIRYLLPAFPFVFVFLGKIVAYRVEKHDQWYKVGVVGLLLWVIISSLSFYPHYIPYFNELIGDRKNIYKYLADSNVDWGQNGIYLHEYVKKHRGKEKISIRPDSPTDGLVLINVNHLVGIYPTIKEKYTWLRNGYEPIDHIGYSWLVYRIPYLNGKEARPSKTSLLQDDSICKIQQSRKQALDYSTRNISHREYRDLYSAMHIV